jgi:hypothetical protein
MTTQTVSSPPVVPMWKRLMLCLVAFLAGTSVNGVFALRACVVNPGSSATGADALVADVRARLSQLTEGGPR